MTLTVDAICAGTAVPFRKGEASAIAKQPVAEIVPITRHGLPSDDQADTVHHGGPDMALHLYPHDHHEAWREVIGDHPLLGQPGAFGTNLSACGIVEADVALGARYRLGSALIEACQPRQPCWKIEHRFGTKGMVKQIMASGRCGWFFRVIEEGEAQAGCTLEQVEPGLPDWTMLRLFEAIWGTSTKWDPALIRDVCELDPLAGKLRAALVARLDAV